ncbi:MAG: hypothetical protein DRH03_11510 [Deltaproteobacteria bacterium]|nr:MAG: hypothetical protein DRH03_11510 [Deltaproteobacteria bacterium]
MANHRTTRTLSVNERFGSWTVLEVPNPLTAKTKIPTLCDCGMKGSPSFIALYTNKSTKCKACGNRQYDSKDVPDGFKQFKGTTLYANKEGQIYSSKMGRLVKPGRGGTNGEYLKLGQSYGGEVYVHRIIALVYIPLEDGRHQINHKDKCTTNNTKENLEWVTPQENLLHAHGYLNYKTDKTKQI